MLGRRQVWRVRWVMTTLRAMLRGLLGLPWELPPLLWVQLVVRPVVWVLPGRRGCRGRHGRLGLLGRLGRHGRVVRGMRLRTWGHAR